MQSFKKNCNFLEEKLLRSGETFTWSVVFSVCVCVFTWACFQQHIYRRWLCHDYRRTTTTISSIFFLSIFSLSIALVVIMAGPNYMYNGVENLACWIDDEDVNDHKKNVDDARGNTYLHHQQQSNVDDRRSHRSRVNKTLSSPSVMANSTPTVNNNIVVINKDVDMKDKIIDKEGPPSEPPEKLMDFDDVLPHIGEFGVYQIILFFLTAPFCLFLAFSYFSQVFITLVPDHTCHVPQLNSSGLNITQK